MLNPLFPASGLMLLLAAPAVAPEPPVWANATALLQQHVTIHVPRMTVTSTTIIVRQPRMLALKEKKTSDCIKLDKISGFTFNATDSVDLVLNDGSLLRAKLGSE